MNVGGAFGGGQSRTLPFEKKKESAMNVQDCVKLNINDKPLTFERAIKYLEYRAENRAPTIAMTLANKVSCKDNAFKPWQRSDGFEKLFVSQMKNNDKDFDLLIEKIRKDIPESELKKYALRRTHSQQLSNHLLPP